MELFLNVLWLATATVALIVVPRRSPRALLALAGAAALLFPIVSVSDDLAGDRDSLEEALAVITMVLLLVVALVAIAHVEPVRIHCAGIALDPATDPRSPPSR